MTRFSVLLCYVVHCPWLWPWHSQCHARDLILIGHGSRRNADPFNRNNKCVSNDCKCQCIICFTYNGTNFAYAAIQLGRVESCGMRNSSDRQWIVCVCKWMPRVQWPCVWVVVVSAAENNIQSIFHINKYYIICISAPNERIDHTYCSLFAPTTRSILGNMIDKLYWAWPDRSDCGRTKSTRNL